MSLKYGIISEIDYPNGVAKVFIDEMDMVTDWLTLPKSINANISFFVKQQVAIIMHENGEDGEILNIIPNDDMKPPSWANEDVEGFQFKDGTKVTYNNKSKKLKIDAGTGELEFVCSKLTVSGDVVAGVNKISLTTHTHTTPAGPSGTPIPTP